MLIYCMLSYRLNVFASYMLVLMHTQAGLNIRLPERHSSLKNAPFIKDPFSFEIAECRDELQIGAVYSLLNLLPRATYSSFDSLVSGH